jgi:hypothetical protein
MLPVYRLYYGYNPGCDRIDRDDYDTQAGWFEEIKSQVNLNRPIQYRIGGHSLVADGWKVTGGTRWYHLNMGWDGGKPDRSCWDPYEGVNTNTWYALDGIPCSQLIWEYMLVDIYPITAVGPVVAGLYPKLEEIRHTYFDMDAIGNRAVFHGDHHVRFIPGVSVTCLGDEGILFYAVAGSPPTRFYTKGDASRGIRIDDGVILLHNKGSLKLY